MATTYTSYGNWVTVSYTYRKTKVSAKFRAKLVTTVKSGTKITCTPYIEVGNAFEKDIRPYYRMKVREGVLKGGTEIEFVDDIDDINQADESEYMGGKDKWSKWARRNIKKGKKDETLRKKGTYKLHSAFDTDDVSVGLKVRVKYTYTTSKKKGKKVEYTKHTKNTGVSTVIVDYTQKPKAPSLLMYDKNAGSMDGAVLLRATFPASETQPLKGAVLQKQNDLSQNSWSDTGRSVNFNIGNSDGIAKDGTEWNVTDQALSPGTKWRYKFVAWNTNNGKRQDTSGAFTNWVYGEPPAVEEFTAVRHGSNDKIAILHIRRAPSNCNRSLIRGFEIQYNNDPNDLGMGTNWRRLVTVKDDNTDGRSSRRYTIEGDTNNVKLGNNTGNAWSVPWTSANVNEFDFLHVGLSGDTGYRYRIRTINATNYKKLNDKENSKWQTSNTYSPGAGGTETVYTSPNPPQSVIAVLNTDMTRTLTITKVNNRTTADTMYIERKIDSGDWTLITDGGTPISDTFTDSTLVTGRSIVYRVAFANAQAFQNPEINKGKSGWRESSELLIIKPPNPPTLSSPINNTKVNIEAPYHRLIWVHNPADMNDQTAYKIAIAFTNSSSASDWYEITGTGDASYYDLTIDKINEIAVSKGHTLQEKDTIYWKVKTQATEEKGYGDYCEPFSFIVIGKPKVRILEPTSTEITTLPLHIEWEYIDNSGDEDPVDVSIAIEQNQRVLKTYKPENMSSRSFDIVRYLFDNNTDYTISLTFVSSSTYSATATFNISINYTTVELVNGLSLYHEFNERFGYSRIVLSTPNGEDVDEPEVTVPEDIEDPYDENEEVDVIPSIEGDDAEEEPEPIVVDSPLYLAYLYRNYDGEKELVKSMSADEIGVVVSNEFTIIDYYSPINREFSYELLQMTEDGQVSLTSYDAHYGEYDPILWWYVIWEKNGEIFSARSRWNPSVNISLSRPEKQQVRYSGREYPVVYDTNARSETASYTMTLFEDEQVEDNGWETLRLYRQMMHDGAHGVWKSFEGDVYTADFDFNYSANYTNKIRSWNCTLNVTRTERED